MRTDWILVVQDMYILSSRSSGVDEDGLDTSCAGQNETILGVHGKNPIIRLKIEDFFCNFSDH